MSIEHHTELMEAALDRNAARAQALMADHIGLTVDVYAQSEDGDRSALQAQTGT